MKTIIKPVTLVFAASVIMLGCGNPGLSFQSDEAIKEINEQALFADNVKPLSYTKFDFENYRSGQLPIEWSQYYTGRGGTDWKIVDSGATKVLAQLYSDNPNSHFNIIVYNPINAKDIALSVRLKSVAGRQDQGGGFIWRFVDKNNYYVVRSNPLEDNIVLYKVENGKRTDLPLIGKGRTYGIGVPPLGSDWNTMELVAKGDLFTVFLNDKELFKVQDTAFTKAGKVGLWTKADAVTYFDDFVIKKYE